MQVLRAGRAGGIASAIPLRGKGGTQARGGLNALDGCLNRRRRPELSSQAACEFRRGGYRRPDLGPPIRGELAVCEGSELTVGHPCHAG